MDFMNADFQEVEPMEVLERLPDSLSLPPLKFQSTDGPSIYESMTQRR